MQEIKINKKITLTTLISSILIVIINNLNIDDYIKGVIIPFSIILISYLFLLKDNEYKNKKAYYLLIPIILVLISGVIIKIDESNQYLNLIIIPLLLSIFFFSLINKNYTISNNFLSWIFKLFPKNLFNNLYYLKVEKSSERDKKFNSIFLGIVFGGFTGFIILGLLVSADDYFKAFIQNITALFKFDIDNIILLIISFIILFSVFINLLKNKEEKMKEMEYKNLDNTMITTILSIVNIVFVLFLISEISRITVNFLRLPLEYTYSSYAREGFFQLLFVTIINFSIIIFILYKTKLIKENKWIKRLIIALILFSLMLIGNSYYRMFLYINSYGFTILRLQVILFLAMETILFSIILKKIITKLNKDALIYFIIIISFYILNLYTCNQMFIDLINK